MNKRLKISIGVLSMNHGKPRATYILSKLPTQVLNLKTGEEESIDVGRELLFMSDVNIRDINIVKGDIVVALPVTEENKPETHDYLITFNKNLEIAIEKIEEAYTGYDDYRDYKFKTATGIYRSGLVLGPIKYKVLK